MADTRHRDVYRVWYKLHKGISEYATFIYAVDATQAMELAERKIPKMTDHPFEILRAEKR